MKERELRSLWDGRRPAMQDARFQSAVLCPFFQRPAGLELLFEVRSAALRRQPGEVCFPGGRMEPGETAAQCALRETKEELGIPPTEVEVLGLADFICHPTGYFLQPVPALVTAAGMAALRPAPAEVAEIFSVPVDFFLDMPPAVYHYTMEPAVPKDFPYDAVGVPPSYSWGRLEVEVPVWRWEGRAIWGATARIVRRLAQVLREGNR